MNQDTLKEVLHYDPSTGHFTWKVQHRNIKIGQIAGATDTTRGGYRRIRVLGRHYSAHKLAWLYMTGYYPSNTIDHIDGNTDNNAWHNLREVTVTENMHNLKKYKNNTTGIAGISYRSDTGKYRARIGVDGKNINLGSYETLEEASAARDAALITHGFHQNHGKR